MIIVVGGGTDFNCQWNASTWSDEGKKKAERTKVEKNKKRKFKTRALIEKVVVSSVTRFSTTRFFNPRLVASEINSSLRFERARVFKRSWLRLCIETVTACRRTIHKEGINARGHVECITLCISPRLSGLIFHQLFH